MTSLSNSRTSLIDGKRVYLVKVARAQRVLIVLVLAAVNLGLPVLLGAVRVVGTPQAWMGWFMLGFPAIARTRT